MLLGAFRRVAASGRVSLALAGRVPFGTLGRIMRNRLRRLLYRRLAYRHHRLSWGILGCGILRPRRAGIERNRGYQEKHPQNSDQKVQLFHAVLLLWVD
jgi:hypothetical protein